MDPDPGVQTGSGSGSQPVKIPGSGSETLVLTLDYLGLPFKLVACMQGDFWTKT